MFYDLQLLLDRHYSYCNVDRILSFSYFHLSFSISFIIYFVGHFFVFMVLLFDLFPSSFNSHHSSFSSPLKRRLSAHIHSISTTLHILLLSTPYSDQLRQRLVRMSVRHHEQIIFLQKREANLFLSLQDCSNVLLETMNHIDR
jgi:hypothetical protein